jgi:hypothetical protein
VLDAFFERILEGFRQTSPPFRGSQRGYRDTPPSLPYKGRSETEGLDRDIQNVLEKKYTLSLGRWYQFFSKVREGSEFGGYYEDLFLSYMSEHHESLLETCIADPFFSGFSELISLEVFGRKRHDTKISYADARRVREISIE